ncbi:predicted protein [Uncinocarpus reesii 1704]|uniref:Beta-lactamase-related domain-containing protein n=1 Tax=Uncinocarpus reesii (strain UAMH 1704) TaxID=336963 RepID=C4JQI2_UNCRE|nr:uncharacterized protein UREG_03327 [Uncinocarpus reesii 1704]EEP78481.1 predicted protein [Uncinocarpus reesii 1704]
MLTSAAFLLCPLAATALQYPLTHSQPSFESPGRQQMQKRLNEILPKIEILRQTGGTAGISVGVISHGDVVLEHFFGFADVHQRLAANSSTRYPIASLTKAFVATTIAQLVDEGSLRWDEPLTTYIPELNFHADPSLAARLTLIDLLSHNTGLLRLDALWLGASSQTVISKEFTVAVCNHLAPVYPLRSKWLYNNWMYALAGEVVERVTGKSFGRALASHVLEKVGLTQTTVIESEVPPDSTAVPYMTLDDKTPVRVPKSELTDGTFMASAGGVRSTVHDMLIWGNALLSVFRDEQSPLKGLDTVLSGHSFINKTFLSDELYALGFSKATTPTQLGKVGFNPGLVDGMPVLGTKSNRETVFYHSGGGTGYNHCFMLVPGSQTAIVVLTNAISHGDIADWVAQTLLQTVLNIDSPVDLVPFAEQAASNWRALYPKMVETLEQGRTPDTREPPHQELLGKFYHPTQALYLEVSIADGALRFSINGRSEQEHKLSHYHYDSFIFLPSDDERVRRGLVHYSAAAWLLHFKRDSTGQVTHIVWNLDGQAPGGETFSKAKA